MNLEFIDRIINDYKKISSENGMSVFDERGLLSRVREIIEWKTLSDDEKHKKRYFVFSVIKKTGNAEAFQFETNIITLYELVELVLSKISSIEEKNELKTRLTAMLEVFKFHVNEHRDTRRMQVASFDLLLNIVASCKGHSLFDSVNEELQKITNLIIDLQKLETNNF